MREKDARVVTAGTFSRVMVQLALLTLYRGVTADRLRLGKKGIMLGQIYEPPAVRLLFLSMALLTMLLGVHATA